MNRQLSMHLDGCCDVCGYPLTDGACGNPVCGGTDEALARRVAWELEQYLIQQHRTEMQRLRDLSFTSGSSSGRTPGSEPGNGGSSPSLEANHA